MLSPDHEIPNISEYSIQICTHGEKASNYSDPMFSIKLVPGGSSAIALYAFPLLAQLYIMTLTLMDSTSNLFLLHFISVSRAKSQAKIISFPFSSSFVLTDSGRDSQTQRGN